MTHHKTKTIGLALGFAGALALAHHAAADAVSDFYSGKQVTIVIAAGPGGGHSVYSQLIAPYLQKAMPGNPSFVVQHMGGAGGTKAANFLYNTAPRDGSSIGILLSDTPLTARLRTTGVKYDPGEFQYLGSAENVHNGLVVRKRSGVASIADAKNKTVIVGSTGKGSQTFIVPTLMNAFIGTKFKVVTGYRGMGGVYLAIDRGEADGFHATLSAVKVLRPDWTKNDLVEVLAVTALDRSPDYPKSPLLVDFVKDPLDRAALELISGNGILGRAWLTTPKVPAQRLAALRAAFEKVTYDPAVMAAAAKRNMNWNPLKWPVLQQQVERIAKADQKVIDHMRKALGAKK